MSVDIRFTNSGDPEYIGFIFEAISLRGGAVYGRIPAGRGTPSRDIMIAKYDNALDAWSICIGKNMGNKFHNIKLITKNVASIPAFSHNPVRTPVEVRPPIEAPSQSNLIESEPDSSYHLRNTRTEDDEKLE